MNVAAHALILTTQRLPVERRREPRPASRPRVALKELRDAQAIAPGRGVAPDSERREANAERRTPRREPADASSALRRRDADERGRLLDVYC